MPDAPVCCGVFVIAADHPCLPGHFPANPVVPGVVLLDRALILINAAHPGRRLLRLQNVRFRRPVRPAQPVLVQSSPGRGGGIDFTGLHDGRVVLSGSASFGA